MTKVTPVASFDKPSAMATSNIHDTHDSVSNFFENEEDDFSKMQTSNKRKRYVNCPLSMFLMSTLVALIVICSLTVYLAVFVGLYTSVDELTNKMVFTVEGQVRNFIDRYLGDLKMTSKLAAGHFNNNLVNKKVYRDYLYQGFNNSGIFVGYFLYIGNKSERYSYTIINGNFLYSYQDNGFPGLIRDKVNITTGQVIKYNFTVSTSPLNLMTTAFYTSAISDSNKLGLEGVFGSPFYTFGGEIALPYSTKVYDPSVYPGVKNLRGLCRATVPLSMLSAYLSKVTVFQRGYIVLTEMNSTTAVGGSIQTTTADGSDNLSLFNLTQKDAGHLMTDISARYNGMNNLPSKIYISSKGVKYIITITQYKFDNLEWRMFIIAFDDDVSFTTNLSIGISIGVSVVIVLIGLVYSLILSKTITRTVKYLEEQLTYVKTFDLDKVTLSSSIFKEMNQIIDDLDKTVLWLKQVKAFIPATVFYQIQGTEQVEEPPRISVEQSKDTNANKYGYHEETHTNGSFHLQKTDTSDSKHKTSSSTLRDSHTNNAIFKLGLQKKTCCMLHITFNKFELQTNYHDISVTFSKVSTMIRNVANMYQAHFQINSTEDIIIVIDQKPNKKHPSELAIECALKISNIIISTNNLLKEHDSHQLDYFIGISTSDDSYVGNLGSHSFRFYSFVSNSRKIANNLAILASTLGVRILIDEQTFNKTNHKYITKPVDRLCLEGSIHSSSQSVEISSVYEVVKEKSIAQDEWLYELNNLNMNKEVDSLNSVFSIFNNASQEKSYSDLDNYLELLSNYLLKFPNDPSIVHLLGVLQYYKEVKNNCSLDELPNLQNYCKKVCYSIQTNTK